MPDYYAVFDIAPDASPDAIKKQYHFLMLVWHPDRFPDDQKAKAAAKTREIIAAYEVLGNPQRRRAYDAQRQGADGEDERRGAEQRREREQAEAERQRQDRQRQDRRAQEEAEEAQRAYEQQQRHQAPPEGFPPRDGFLNYTRQQIIIAGLGIVVLVGCLLFFARGDFSPTTSAPQVTRNAPRDDQNQAAPRGTSETVPWQISREKARGSGNVGEGGGTASFLWSVVKGLAKVVWVFLMLMFEFLKFFVVTAANLLSGVGNNTNPCLLSVNCKESQPQPVVKVESPAEIHIKRSRRYFYDNAATDFYEYLNKTSLYRFSEMAKSHEDFMATFPPKTEEKYDTINISNSDANTKITANFLTNLTERKNNSKDYIGNKYSLKFYVYSQLDKMRVLKDGNTREMQCFHIYFRTIFVENNQNSPYSVPEQKNEICKEKDKTYIFSSSPSINYNGPPNDPPKDPPLDKQSFKNEFQRNIRSAFQSFL